MLRITCFALVLGVACQLVYTRPAWAVDKRVIMMGKTAGYGAVAGFLVGGGGLIMGLGTTANLYRGASLGLYAGILFGTFILVTQGGTDERRFDNPWRPQKPMTPDDWQENEYEKDFGSEKVTVWSPLISFNF